MRPGVYLFHDENRTVIYVGKAKSLRKRVQSYFRHGGFASPRLRKLVSSIRDISFIRTETEAEALITEARLIKQYQPFFNIDLKMGERYPYVKITDEPFPRIVITRHREEGDGADYIGPFVSAGELRQMLRLVERFFPLRICGADSRGGKWAARPCVRYDLGRCLGPCAGLADPSEYRERVADIALLLRGQSASLVGRLRERMDKAAASMDFETAGRYRDTIRAIWRLSRRHVSMVFSDPLDGGTWKSLTQLQEVLSLPDPSLEDRGVRHLPFRRRRGLRSLRCFRAGPPEPSLYRKYRIRTVEGSMTSGPSRRSWREGTKGSWRSRVLPQLISDRRRPRPALLRLEALKALGLAEVPVAAIAKREERFTCPGGGTDPPAPGERSPDAPPAGKGRVPPVCHRRQQEGRQEEDVPLVAEDAGHRQDTRLEAPFEVRQRRQDIHTDPEEVSSVKGVSAEAAKR